jgi:MoxR-like ATPase
LIYILIGENKVLWGKEKTVETLQYDMLDESQLSIFYPKIQEFLNQVNQIVLDKNQQTQLALCSLLAGGHILFEDLPGLGKTTLASSLAHLAGLQFKRIQFTNDMLASDVIGVNMFNQKEHLFEFK